MRNKAMVMMFVLTLLAGTVLATTPIRVEFADLEGQNTGSSNPDQLPALVDLGLNVTKVNEDPATFTAAGAVFDTANEGDGGRNYIRTIDIDYDSQDFTAYIVVVSPTTNQNIFFGMGSAQMGSWGVFDYGVGGASTIGCELRDRFNVVWRNDNTGAQGIDTAINDGVITYSPEMLIMMAYDAAAKTMSFYLDQENDGSFDYEPITVDITGFFDNDKNARILIGADESGTIKNLYVDTESTLVANNPSPVFGQTGVLTDATLTWSVAEEPNSPGTPVSDFDSHLLLISENWKDIADANDFDGVLLATGSYTPGVYDATTNPGGLAMDKTYYWRVNEKIAGDPNVTYIRGNIWFFETQKSVPVIDVQPANQAIESGDPAIFNIEVTSLSAPNYTWFKYVDGTNDIDLTTIADADITGADTDTLTIANAEIADEAGYYCVVSNDSGTDVPSDQAAVIIKRLLAYWPFDIADDPNSVIAGSPVTSALGAPTFLTEGVSGGAFQFDGSDDAFYTETAQADYFKACDNAMTVTCFVKSSGQVSWTPYISKHGESGLGWQLRQRGGDRKACFTTRGTGNDDGTGSITDIYDGQWHFVTGTFDGTEKKLYIDGILEVTDAVSGSINYSTSPVVFGARIWEEPDGFKIGGFASISIDEAQIYNYALTAEEVIQLAANLSSQPVCREYPVGDIVRDCKVDMLDLAELAKNWLTDNNVVPE